eukprot:2275066-Rhodomonas_salina.1
MGMGMGMGGVRPAVDAVAVPHEGVGCDRYREHQQSVLLPLTSVNEDAHGRPQSNSMLREDEWMACMAGTAPPVPARRETTRDETAQSTTGRSVQ